MSFEAFILAFACGVAGVIVTLFGSCMDRDDLEAHSRVVVTIGVVMIVAAASRIVIGVVLQ